MHTECANTNSAFLNDYVIVSHSSNEIMSPAIFHLRNRHRFLDPLRARGWTKNMAIEQKVLQIRSLKPFYISHRGKRLRAQNN